MAQAFGSVGASATGNGTGTTAPGAPASISAGNTLILVLAISTLGSTGAAVTPTTPVGWTLLGSGKNESTTVGDQIFVYGKIAVGGDTMPTQTWTPTTKWTNQVYRYTGVGGSGLPTATFGPGQTNSSSTSNVCSIGGTAATQWVSYIYSERSSTNTSYGTTITGLTQRGSGFGSGGGAVDIGLYDTNGTISGTIPSRTAVAGIAGVWGENCILLWPAAGTAWTDSETDLTNPTDAVHVDIATTLPYPAGGSVSVTEKGQLFVGSTTTQTVVSLGAPGWTPSPGDVIAIAILQSIASGSPSTGSMSDNWGDTGGTTWALQSSQSAGTDKVEWFTRIIGTGAGAGWPTWTGPSGSSMLRQGMMYALEVSGVSDDTASQTAGATGSTTGLLSVSFASTPAPTSLVLSLMETADLTLNAGPSGFTVIDTNGFGSNNSTLAYQLGSVPQTHAWPQETATHCAATAIELPVAPGVSQDNVGLTDSISAVLTHAFTGWGTPL